MAVGTGLEPATPCVTGTYSNQLNYPTVAVKRCKSNVNFQLHKLFHVIFFFLSLAAHLSKNLPLGPCRAPFEGPRLHLSLRESLASPILPEQGNVPLKNLRTNIVKVHFNPVNVYTVRKVIFSSKHVAYPLRLQTFRFENYISPTICDNCFY